MHGAIGRYRNCADSSFWICVKSNVISRESERDNRQSKQWRREKAHCERMPKKKELKESCRIEMRKWYELYKWHTVLYNSWHSWFVFFHRDSQEVGVGVFLAGICSIILLLFGNKKTLKHSKILKLTDYLLVVWCACSQVPRSVRIYGTLVHAILCRFYQFVGWLFFAPVNKPTDERVKETSLRWCD